MAITVRNSNSLEKLKKIFFFIPYAQWISLWSKFTPVIVIVTFTIYPVIVTSVLRTCQYNEGTNQITPIAMTINSVFNVLNITNAKHIKYQIVILNQELFTLQRN